MTPKLFMVMVEVGGAEVEAAAGWFDAGSGDFERGPIEIHNTGQGPGHPILEKRAGDV